MKRNGINDMLQINAESGMKKSPSSDTVPNMNGKLELD